MTQMLRPVVNTDVRMPKGMMRALNLLEASCAIARKDEVSVDEVTAFLERKFGRETALSFRAEFLFSSPAPSEAARQ